MVNIFKIILGTVITSVIPVLIIEWAKRKRYLIENDFLHRNFLYYITMFSVVIIGNIYGNTDLVFAIIVSSLLIHLLGISGVNQMISGNNQQISFGKNGYFLTFITAFFLLLGSDYLLSEMQKNRVNQISQNGFSRLDGIWLLLLFVIFLLLKYQEGKKDLQNQSTIDGSKTKHIILQTAKQFLYNENSKKNVLIYFVIILCIIFGEIILVNGIVNTAVEQNFSIYFMAFTIGAWGCNISYAVLSGKEQIKIIIQEESYIQGIVMITAGIGLTALWHPFSITMWNIQDIILMCIIVIILQFIEKLSYNWKGSIMTSCYIGIMIYFFIR